MPLPVVPQEKNDQTQRDSGEPPNRIQSGRKHLKEDDTSETAADIDEVRLDRIANSSEPPSERLAWTDHRSGDEQKEERYDNLDWNHKSCDILYTNFGPEID